MVRHRLYNTQHAYNQGKRQAKKGLCQARNVWIECTILSIPTQPYFYGVVYCIESLQQPFSNWNFNWRRQDLNPGPSKHQSNAQPTKLSWLESGVLFSMSDMSFYLVCTWFYLNMTVLVTKFGFSRFLFSRIFLFSSVVKSTWLPDWVNNLWLGF